MSLKRYGTIFYLIGGAISVTLLCTLSLLNLTPSVSRDALVHHLAIPKLYLELGGMKDLPCFLHSYYPGNVDLMYLAGLYLGSDISAKFIHFGFGILTAMLIGYYLLKRIGNAYAVLGGILFLCIPVIIRLSTTAYVDLGLVFFSTASLLALFSWADKTFKFRYLALAGVCCGLSMGTKYNGLVTCFLLACLIPILHLSTVKIKLRAIVKSMCFALVFVLICCAIFLPWMVRNWKWTGNPVYPLFDSVFAQNHKTPCKVAPLISKTDPGYNVFLYRQFLYNENAFDILTIPFRIFFQGRDDNFQYFDGKLLLFLLILPLFSFLKVNNRPSPHLLEKKAMLLFAVFFFLIVLFSRVLRVRYFAPSLPGLVILSVFGIHNLISTACTSESKRLRTLCLALVSIILIHTFYSTGKYLIGQFERYTPVAYITGRIQRDEYIAKFRHEYPVFRYINEKLPKDSEILFIYVGKRGYYCDRSYIPDNGHHLSVIHRLIREGNSPDAIAEWFLKKGITHLLIHRGHVRERLMRDFDKKEREFFYFFITIHTEVLFSNGAFALYSLKS